MPAPARPAPPTSDIGQPDFWWGTWGQGLLTEWWETAADLIWPQSVITYGRMRHDPQIRAVLAAYTWPIVRATWALDGEGCDPKVTRHCADDLGLPILGLDEHPGPARRRGVIWTRHLRQAAQKLTFGHAIFERRYELQADGLYHLAALGPRMPWTIAQMHIARDGTIQEVQQTINDKPIPAQRLVWYVNELEGASWAGISALRAAFGAWLLKHETWRVHATSIRRFGMGIPAVEAPPGGSANQVSQAAQLAAGMRVGDQAGVGLPAGFKFMLSGLTGSVPDALAFVRYLDQQISKMALAGLVDLGQTEIGSRALGETFLDLFTLALQGHADELAVEATSGHPGMPGIVTDLVTVNYGEDEPCPNIVCTDAGQQHEVTAQALMYLLQYGGLTPDPELEAWIRQAWRLPQRRSPQPAMNPPAPKDELTPPTPGPAPLGAGRGRVSRIRVAAALRRKPTPREVHAGFDPTGHQQAWLSELGWLLSQWTAVSQAQRVALVDAVVAAVDASRLDKLPGLKVTGDNGAALVEQAMQALVAQAVSAVQQEAAKQGVDVPASKVKVNGKALGQIAAARAALAGGYLAQQAGMFALQAAQAGSGEDAGAFVATKLDQMSPAFLRLQLGSALTAAQNEGRFAVFSAAPSAAYVATEILDDNTCEPCRTIDGYEFATLTDAAAAYANGGYVECLGGERCRGTVFGMWDQAP